MSKMIAVECCTVCGGVSLLFEGHQAAWEAFPNATQLASFLCVICPTHPQQQRGDIVEAGWGFRERKG